MVNIMTSRERITAALRFKECDTVPIEVRDCTLGGVHFPPWYSDGEINRKGSYTDLWGCKWFALEDGVCGEVKYHPLEDWSKLDSFKPPMEYLKKLDLSGVNRFCESTDKFVCPMWEPAMPNLFERLQHLRGTENLFMDLAYGDSRIFKLIDRLNEYYFPLLEKWAATDVDALHLADDWGTQISLLISPDMWREYFKPVYKRFVDIGKAQNKFMLFHSDGFIESIIEDFIDIGIDSINSQIFCMNIEELAHKYHHKIAFWGEIDRQYLQVFGEPGDIRAGVRRLADAFFKYGRTGFVAQCIYMKGAKEENKRAEWDEWEKVSAGWAR